MEKDSDLLNKKKTVQISVTDKDGKEHPIDVETEMVPVGHEINYQTEMSGGQRILKPEKYMRQFPNIMPCTFRNFKLV